MYSLLVVALLGSVGAVPLAQVEPRTTDLASQYYLPRETTPVFYDVRLYLNPDNTDYFYGNVTIRLIPRIETQQIVLHAMAMQIDEIRLYSEREQDTELFSSFVQATDDTHFLTINTTEVLQTAQIYVLHINYVGQYAANMFGIYVSSYDSNGTAARLITSQLQPTFSRRAFPCYDEPALKAIFRTTIFAPNNYPVVRSNMPVASTTDEGNGWVRHQFQDTVIMSSYLLAYLVSNFEFIENDVSPIYNVPFRVYSRPGSSDNAAFALDFGQRNMLALENYTDFPYALPKMDKVAVPDFAAGAMENWGLVVYREVALLVNDGVTTTSARQNVGRIICHENMHMWFGNEVSPVSWTYTWLNEGFANFFENFATDLVVPEWRMMDQYVIAMQNVFQSDAVVSVNPMTFDVFTPSQILGTFNAVAYQKSGSVIRMMQHFLTPEVFRQGLILYLRSMSRSAAQPSDLYTYLQLALNQSNHTITTSLATIMTRWTTQGGFPVVTVTRSSPSANSLVFAQERYLTDRSQSSNDRWHIPVNVAMSTNPSFEDTRPDGWIPPTFPATSLNIQGLAESEWYIVNKQQTGYYRVNYEEENWAALARLLSTSHETIHVLNRAQIVDDSFNLARNGRLPYTYPLQIATYLSRELDYIPWAAANPAFTYLDVVLSATSTYELFQRFILEQTAPLYERLTFDASPTEEFVTAYHRNIILDLNCRYQNPNCVNTSNEYLTRFRENGQALNPDIQTLVFCSGLRGGSTDNFDFLWNRYTSTADSSAQAVLLNALGCTSNPDRRDFFLRQIIAPDSVVREQDRHSIAVAVINSGAANMEVALDFVIDNFPQIQPNVQGLTGTTNILNALSRRLTSTTHREKIETFVERHSGIFTAGELAAIAAIRENIAASIAWSEQNYDTVAAWIDDYYTDSATSVAASFLLVISMFIAIFNH